MSRSICALAIALMFCGTALGQVGETLKRRCEKVIVDSINESKNQGDPLYWRINRARLVPVEETQEFLLKCLTSDDNGIRLAAANRLAEESPQRFAEPITSMFSKLKLNKGSELVQKTVILAKLKDSSSLEQLATWAEQIEKHERIKLPEPDSNEWICPMVCAEPTHRAGKCPVCGMELVPRKISSPFEDWQLKLRVLLALRDLGEKTARKARVIVGSDADSITRMQAAELWAKEEPTAALPHLNLFLHSANHDIAISILANVAAEQSVAAFEAVLKNSTDSFTRFEAWRGLLSAGKSQYLADIRESVDQTTNSEEEKTQKAYAINLLGTFGDQDDLARLEKLLDSEFKVFVAESLMSALKRKF